MKKFVELFLVSFLAITLASGAASITATRIPTAIADGGGAGSTGYPYAVFVTISGWTTAANSQAYVKLYNSTNNEYMWSSSNAWSNTTTYNTANQPVVNIDASGNWSGWIYAKHNTSLGTAASVRAAKVGATSTNLTSSSQIFTILNTATSGGWIIGQTSSAVNKGIVAYSGGSMVGTYRTEDNSITEGYSYGSGGFKIAVPIGSVDSLVAYNDDGSAFQTFIGPWIISAGVETDFSSVSVLASGSASVSPYMWKYNSPTNLQFVIKPTTDTLKGIRIIKPSILSWNTGAITVLPNSAGLSFNGDTVQISNISLSGQDSVVLTCDGTTAIDTTNIFSVIIQTSNDGISYGQISTLPQVFIYGSPRAISAVKQKEASGAHTLLGKWVVIKGIVTVANEFAGGNAPGGPAYIQDETGAATLYDTAIVNNVQRGDEIIVLGVVAPFNELFELAPCLLLETVSSGNPFDTTVVTIAQLLSQVPTAVEQYEGKLVRINGITSVNTATWTVTGSGTNYNITDATGTMQTRISPRVNLANLPAPSGAFDMVCVVGQFNTTYQVLPRSYDDIIVENQGPRIISQSPFESNIQPTSLTISWITDVAGTSVVKYGKTSSLDLTVSDTNKVTQHQVALPNLTSATTYFVQIQTANAIGTTTGPVFLSSTSSQNSSGTINVYFNKSVNTTVALGENAQTVSNLSQKAIDRINAATYSIDVALYSFSGTVGTNIANALVAAKNRNVKVRVIGESENQGSTSKWSTLTNAGIPVIFDTYDATNGGAGLMHDKFYIFDNRDTMSESDDWVIMGSWNATDPGTNNDAQNIVEIQDKALANAYTREFEEMWGSSTETPNSSASRFGARKLDNTPHFFEVNGTPMELYFSPSDHVTNRIISTINKATNSVNFALYSFTRNDIGNALVAKKNSGVNIRGIFDNRGPNELYDTLKNRGIDVLLKGFSGGLLHHKYGIIDAETTSPNQYIITGSHNWSSNAENSNNENTLIVRSKRIANLYLQEFKARYIEAGGVDTILVSVNRENTIVPNEFSLQQNYPNPFNPETNIQFQIAKSGLVRLSVYDVLGREVTSLVHQQLHPGVYSVRWNASSFSSGVYYYRLQSGTNVEVKKMMLIR